MYLSERCLSQGSSSLHRFHTIKGLQSLVPSKNSSQVTAAESLAVSGYKSSWNRSDWNSTHHLDYWEIILLHGHEFSWLDDDGHVRGLFNSWIFKLYAQLLNVNLWPLLWGPFRHQGNNFITRAHIFVV